MNAAQRRKARRAAERALDRPSDEGSQARNAVKQAFSQMGVIDKGDHWEMPARKRHEEHERVIRQTGGLAYVIPAFLLGLAVLVAMLIRRCS